MTHPRHPEHNAAPPQPTHPRDPGTILLVAGLVPIGMSVAAVVTSIWCPDPVVARTAWIVVAVVGSATMISVATTLKPPRGPRKPADDQTPPQ